MADGVSKVVFRPDGRYAFANSAKAPVLPVIDARSDEVVKRIPVVSPFSPDLWISSDGEEVWQGNKDVGKVTVTDHLQFADTPDGEFAYVTVGAPASLTYTSAARAGPGWWRRYR